MTDFSKKIMVWLCAIVSSVWVVLTIKYLFVLNSDDSWQLAKGIELVFLIPAIVIPILIEFSSLVYFILEKKSRQIIVLSIIQGSILGAFIIAIPLSQLVGGIIIDKEKKKYYQFSTVYEGLKEMPKENVERMERMLLEKHFKAICQSIQKMDSKEQCLDRIDKEPLKNPLMGTNREAANLPISKILSVEFSNTADASFVKLTFDYSVADYFNIYRAVSPNGPWEFIYADVPSSAQGLIENSYNFPKNAEVLYYRITVSDGQGGEGPYSPVSSVNLK